MAARHDNDSTVPAVTRSVVIYALIRGIGVRLPKKAFFAFQEGGFKSSCVDILTRGGYSIIEPAGTNNSKVHLISTTPDGRLIMDPVKRSRFDGYFIKGVKTDIRIVCDKPLLLELKVMPPMGSLSGKSKKRFLEDLGVLWRGECHGMLQIHHGSSYDYLKTLVPGLVPLRRRHRDDNGDSLGWYTGEYAPTPDDTPRTYHVAVMMVSAEVSKTGTVMAIVGIFDVALGLVA